MAGRSRSRPRKKRSVADANETIFADPNTVQRRNPQRKRESIQQSSGMNGERPTKKPAQKNGGQSRHKPRRKRQRQNNQETHETRHSRQRQRPNNQEQNKPRHSPSSEDLFVDPIRPKKENGIQSQQTKGRKRPPNKQNRRKPGRNQHKPKKFTDILLWDSPDDYVRVCHEESMVEFMFKQNGEKERGMMKAKPDFVVSKFKSAIRGMTLPQALSLRRHHIKLLNPSKTMTQLGLGKVWAINTSARMFEIAVEDFLTKCSVKYITEKKQIKEAREKGTPLTATPDFFLPTPVLLQKVRNGRGRIGSTILEERTIHWIEVKMYYGASTIPPGKKNGAVGSVLAQAKKYVKNFGEGAFLFMMGCGEQLAADLNDNGVSVLDCSGNTVALGKVHEHQRTWCANDSGQILP